jgi:RNA polymerase sigma-70 factor (ECF subfamily)
MGNDLPRPMKAETPDAVLVGRLAQGERHALELLFRRHNGRVFRFLARLMDNEAVAGELVSEVFLEVWRNAGEFEARSQVSDLASSDRPPQGAVGSAAAHRR